MDWIGPIISHPFTWGFGLGLVLAAFVLKGAWTARGNFQREIKRLNGEIAQLQQHIQTHLKITASGSERLEQELAALKQQNETLRINVAALQQKPGRIEARQLQVYEAAVARMREQAPGFAQAWERALREASAEQDAAESGFSRLMRKVLPGSAPSTTPAESTPLIPPGPGTAS